MEENPELIKSSTLNAVANDGAGVCYDAYALCQKREKVDISENIPIYIWQGTADDMVPVSFLDYYKAEYKIKEIHMIENVGHILPTSNCETFRYICNVEQTPIAACSV